VGDLLPRVVAVLEPGFTLPAHRAAVRTLWLLRPVFRVVAWADRHGHPHPPDARRGAVDSYVVRGMITLPDSTVGDIMTPRIDIVAVDAADHWDHVVDTLRRSEHARILVYDGNPDAVTGVLYAKDMLAALAAAAEAPWTTLIRPVPFVPEGKSLDRQLRDFQRGPQHLAVVVDEYGGTAGLVTLEDILEEIVGEIHDEYDTDEVAEIEQVRADTWVVQGEAPLADLEAELHHEFDREDVSTVGGLVLAEFGRVPRPRETIQVNGFRVTVDLMIRRRVKRVVVERLPPAVEASAKGDEE
jgi:CBS domain containing-hemolysin-like protein